jgi:hypothetical protein
MVAATPAAEISITSRKAEVFQLEIAKKLPLAVRNTSNVVKFARDLDKERKRFAESPTSGIRDAAAPAEANASLRRRFCRLANGCLPEGRKHVRSAANRWRRFPLAHAALAADAESPQP